MKHFISPLLDPLGAIWLLMFLCLLWLIWKRQWRSAFWLALPTVLIFILGSTPLIDRLVENAERLYAPGNLANLSPADAVIALGGGQGISQQDPLGFSMSDAGDRNLVAIELVRLGKARMLVLGGSGGFPDRPTVPAMTVVQDWIASWRLSSIAVTNLGICGDTHDEALQAQKMKDALGWQKIILVTSALHMKRSVALFNKFGMDVIPIACDFQIYGVLSPRLNDFSPFPRQDRFVLWSLYLHELIGWQVYKCRRWI